MRFPYLSSALLALVLAILADPLQAAAPSLQSATLTFIQKDVSIADIDVVQVSSNGQVQRRKANLQDAINKNNAVITGEKSRAELRFNDGSIARLGQLTSFTFTQGTRDMNLKQGSGLFQIPKGMGGTKIQAGPVTAAITGTTLLLQVFADRVILYVYEGSVDAADKTIKAGQVITIFNDGRIEISSFDPAKGIATAALFTKFVDAPSQKELMDALKEVLTAIERGEVPPNNNNDVIDVAVLNEIIRVRRDAPAQTRIPTFPTPAPTDSHHTT
ncbi:MAG: FecR domain-containing protein [Blastochloris sp.]|nr:FecR domain-containing protein [Blastochloris sp.]